MNRTRLSPIDILGVTLGVIVLLVVIGSIVAIAQGRMMMGGMGPDWRAWSGPAWRGWSAPGSAIREEKDQQVAGDFSVVEVRNVAGSIEVNGTSPSGVAIHSVKTAAFPSAADNVRVDVQNLGNRLVVEEKHGPGFINNMGTISFTIAIPKGVKVVEAHSVSGSITVHDVEPGIDQTLSTISGSVSTSRARNLDASSRSGHVQFVFDGQRLNAHTISGSVDGDIASLDKGGSVTLSSISGSISVGAFPALDAAMSLHSVSGSVSCGFPVTIDEQKHNKLRGRIGGGSSTMDARTVSGSITINKM
jgi:DUF4097 and DUF4098 domain-containing protein YvlB